MANAPFDRTIINAREKPLSQDINQAQSELDIALRFALRQLFANYATGDSVDGFVQSGFNVVANSPATLGVSVKAGLGFQTQEDQVASNIDNVLELNDLSAYKPLVLQNAVSFTTPTAPASPDSRIDIIEVKAGFFTGESSSRQVLDENTGAFDPTAVNKILSFLVDGRIDTIQSPANATQALTYKTGVAANPGLVPDTTDGYIKLAEITVGSDVTTIVTADITDERPRLSVGGGGAKVLNVHAAAFIPEDSDSYYADSAVDNAFTREDGHAVTTLPLSVMYPIALPVGSKILGLASYAEFTGSLGPPFTLTLMRIPKDTNVVESLATTAITNTGAISIANLSLVMEVDFAYWINVTMSAEANFRWAELSYEDR